MQTAASTEKRKEETEQQTSHPEVPEKMEAVIPVMAENQVPKEQVRFLS